MIKMIVSDIDGTIVGKDEILHDAFVNYVEEVRKNGIYFTIATGRTVGLAEEYVRKLCIDIPYITCNGGTIVQNGELLRHKTVPFSNLREIFEKADKMGMSVLYSIGGTEYAYKETPYISEQRRTYGRYKTARAITEDEWRFGKAEKVIVMAAVRDGSIGEIEALCKKLPVPFYYKRYADKAIDILNCEATKEQGIKALAKMMDLSLDEVLFAGDDLNDVELLKQAGVGIAPANAQPQAKAAADYIAGERTELGVMEAVDKFTKIYAMKKVLDNSLRRQSYSLSRLMKIMADDLKEQLEVLFNEKEAGNIEKIVLTGCGDSYCTGLTLWNELEKMTGIPTELVTAIDFSRYYSERKITEKTLLVVISISGNGARITECMKKAKIYGAKTLAVTKNHNSDIGSLSDKILELKIPEFESGPGNRTYFASLLAMILFGLHIGTVRKTISEEDKAFCEQEVRRQGKVLEKLLPEIDDELFELAKAWKDKQCFDFTGSGMDYGSGWFAHAKIIEITGAFAMHINSEEWFHMNNFVKNIAQCATVIFASLCSSGFSRTKEAVSYAAKIGRPLLIITDASKEDFEIDIIENKNIHYIKIEHSDFMPAMALTQYVPFCVLAGYMGAMLGEKNCRGCLGAWSFAAGGRFIRDSEMTEYF